MAQNSHQGGKDGTVSIIIDKKHKESPTPTTGAALYALGEVASGYELFKEVHGKGDDEAIANDGTAVALKAGDHFYSAQKTLNPGTACD
jgi:hypothetical protein